LAELPRAAISALNLTEIDIAAIESLICVNTR